MNYPPFGETRGADDGLCEVVQCPSDAAALTNLVYIAPGAIDPKIHSVIVDHEYVFSCRTDRNILKGQIGINGPHRRWASFSLGQRVSVLPYDIHSEGMGSYLSLLRLDIDFFSRSMRLPDEFKEDEIETAFITNFHSQIFTKGQMFVFEYTGIKFRATVADLDVVDLNVLKKGDVDVQQEKNAAAVRGILMRETNVEFNKVEGSNLNLKQSTKRAMKTKNLVKTGVSFEELGIGGLDTEINVILRRAFASRTYPPALVEQLGVQHVKGILLYGPPGTGKTLIARSIGEMLNAREPKVVSGPEVLSKFVGQSEENVRKLFADAEDEYRTKGEDSGLHIIILDELDAICKARGSRSGDTGVGDSVVNQLLAKMDGVKQLNNILIVGMTNRKEIIDEALLRPGRFEVHIEIGLPDEEGRLQIFKIHTNKMRTNELMAEDVDLNELAQLTKNYSGAEISGVVRAATSFALNRHMKVNKGAVSVDASDLRVCMDDFLEGLKEVQPALGVSEEELQRSVELGIIPFSPNIEQILTIGKLYVDQVKQSKRTPLASVLLHGLSGSGKTALAVTIAMQSGFPFIKLVSATNMIGMSESAKVNEITKVFTDSYKSPTSVIVLDDIEKLLEYVPIGPRFSNSILQCLISLIQKKPPKGRRLLILATTSERHLLDQVTMTKLFAREIYVPTINSLDNVDVVLQEERLFSDNERERVLNYLREANLDKNLTIGVKRLLTHIDTARQAADKVDEFVQSMMEQ